MIPYTDEEMAWVTTGKYKKSNLNRERKIKAEEDNRLSHEPGASVPR